MVGWVCSACMPPCFVRSLRYTRSGGVSRTDVDWTPIRLHPLPTEKRVLSGFVCFVCCVCNSTLVYPTAVHHFRIQNRRNKGCGCFHSVRGVGEVCEMLNIDGLVRLAELCPQISNDKVGSSQEHDSRKKRPEDDVDAIRASPVRMMGSCRH